MQNETSWRKHKIEKGIIYGRLTLTGKSYLKEMYGQLRRVVEADCICGVLKWYVFSSLQCGDTKSCGCLKNDLARERMTTHGLSQHPLYFVWQAIIKRCYKPNTEAYPDYGGRGIEVCDEWGEFLPFYDWCVEQGYQTGRSVERKNNDGNYSPENCCLATRPIQNRNTRRNVNLTAWGETKCLFDWSQDKRCKISYWGLRNRIDRGKWANDIEGAIGKPIEDNVKVARNKKNNRYLTAWGETKCFSEWLEDKRCLVKIDSLRDRLAKGWDAEKSMGTRPSRDGKNSK